VSDGGAFVTGLKEARAFAEALPDEVKAKLKQVAADTAERIRAGYVQRLTEQTHGTGKTARSARVLDESDENRFVVNVPGDPSQPANLPRWLEYGTRFMEARPALRPAGDAENERYKSDMADAAESVLKDA